MLFYHFINLALYVYIYIYNRKILPRSISREKKMLKENVFFKLMQ